MCILQPFFIIEMKFTIKLLWIFIFWFSVWIIFCFSSKTIIDYIPKIANILSWDKIDENIKKTSEKEFFWEVKKEKIWQYMKVLRKEWYKTYYSSFLSHSWMFIGYTVETDNNPSKSNFIPDNNLLNNELSSNDFDKKTSKKDYSWNINLTWLLPSLQWQENIYFSNLWNISLSTNTLNYFIWKNFEDIKKQEREALAFICDYKNNILIKEFLSKNNLNIINKSCHWAVKQIHWQILWTIIVLKIEYNI